MTFWNSSGYRTILDTETDSSSPVSEELMSQLRENIEVLLINTYAAESSGVASKNPSSATTGLFYANKSWTSGLHNYRTLMILSGNAKGNKYKIWRTIAASSAVSSSGNNLYSDGVRSGDRFRILYSIKGSSGYPQEGHNHDGVNSKTAVVQSSAITNAMIQTSAVTVRTLRTKYSSVTISTANFNFVLPGGQYGFYPQLKVSTQGVLADVYLARGIAGAPLTTGYRTVIGTGNTTTLDNTARLYAQQRYVST